MASTLLKERSAASAMCPCWRMDATTTLEAPHTWRMPQVKSMKLIKILPTTAASTMYRQEKSACSNRCSTCLHLDGFRLDRVSDVPGAPSDGDGAGAEDTCTHKVRTRCFRTSARQLFDAPEKLRALMAKRGEDNLAVSITLSSCISQDLHYKDAMQDCGSQNNAKRPRTAWACNARHRLSTIRWLHAECSNGGPRRTCGFHEKVRSACAVRKTGVVDICTVRTRRVHQGHRLSAVCCMSEQKA